MLSSIEVVPRLTKHVVQLVSVCLVPSFQEQSLAILRFLSPSLIWSVTCFLLFTIEGLKNGSLGSA